MSGGYLKNLWTPLCVSILLIIGCEGPTKSEVNNKEKNELLYDTSRVAIIPFDSTWNYPFDKSYEPATLTQRDIRQIDSIVNACIETYNKLLEMDFKGTDIKAYSIDLTEQNYKKQLIVARKHNGAKEVWVNCFCKEMNHKWKTDILSVQDGGNCFFNLKIDLTTKKCYDIVVNGYA